MVEILNQLIDRVKTTGEIILEVSITELVQYAVLRDDTDACLTVEYNFKEEVWE